jgi:hypothetical protein
MQHVLLTLEDGLHVCQSSERNQIQKFKTCVDIVETTQPLPMTK